MTHRERVMAALEHRIPDRLPCDVGSARFTGIVKPAYERLRAHLGFGSPGVVTDRMQQLVEVDEAVLQFLGVDCRAVSQGAPDRGGDVVLPGDAYRDEWGVTRRRPEGGTYYELCDPPLAGPCDAARIAHYPWPDPTDPGRLRGLRERIAALRKTEYAVIYNARYSVVHQAQYLRGFEDWYCDLAGDPGLFTALMQAVTENVLELNRRILGEIGPLIDIVAFGDDVGLQKGPVCSPKLYRELIRPWHERIVEQIRTCTNAKILYHTCGSVYHFIPDFIDMGIDALNPVQTTAKNMEPERLAREFGGRIAFWGGVDSHHVLPCGTPDDVRSEVRRLAAILGQSGGYVAAAVHNIQPDVPPENIVALFDEAKRCTYNRCGDELAHSTGEVTSSIPGFGRNPT